MDDRRYGMSGRPTKRVSQKLARTSFCTVCRRRLAQRQGLAQHHRQTTRLWSHGANTSHLGDWTSDASTTKPFLSTILWYVWRAHTLYHTLFINTFHPISTQPPIFIPSITTSDLPAISIYLIKPLSSLNSPFHLRHTPVIPVSPPRCVWRVQVTVS